MAASHISIQFTDTEGGKKSIPFYIPNGLTLVEITAFATTLVAAINAVSTAGVQKVEACIEIPNLGFFGAAGSRVDAGARLGFLNTVGNTLSYYIPSFDVTKMANGIVNIADADVAALATILVDGSGGVNPCDRNLLDLQAFTGGQQCVRKL